MKVRAFAMRDLARVVQIERMSFGPDSYSLTTFLAHVLRDRGGMFVAEDEEGCVVGYVLARMTLGWVGKRRGGITSIAVDPARRRCGIGRCLVARSLEHLREGGVEEADLEVNITNRAAHSLYEAFGFHHDRVLPHYYGPERDGLKMVADLRGARSAEQVEARQAKRAHYG